MIGFDEKYEITTFITLLHAEGSFFAIFRAKSCLLHATVCLKTYSVQVYVGLKQQIGGKIFFHNKGSSIR